MYMSVAFFWLQTHWSCHEFALVILLQTHWSCHKFSPQNFTYNFRFATDENIYGWKRPIEVLKKAKNKRKRLHQRFGVRECGLRNINTTEAAQQEEAR